jgi:hypothetical protein
VAVATTVVAVVTTLMPAAPARAQSTCRFDAATGVVEVTTSATPDGSGATYLGRFGDTITMNGTACGAATVAATESVQILNRVDDGDVVLDLRNGLLAPGRTPEGGGESEIEVRLSGTAIHQLTFLFARGDDDVRLWTSNLSGAWLANLTPGADRDADVALEAHEVQSVVVVAGPGNDSVQSLGFPEPVDPFAGRVWFIGGSGSDRLLLGPMRPSTARYSGFSFAPGRGTNDVLDLSQLPKVWDVGSGSGLPFSVSLANGQPVGQVIGHRGVDALWSTSVGQRLVGLAGRDALYGRGGSDIIAGGPGADALSGGNGADFVSGGAGADDVDGGRGVDRCRTGRRDTVRSCEIHV